MRAYRMNSGLKQKDVAALLGFESGSIISRAEMGNGMPSVPVLLGYCILFEVLPKDLVPGVFQDMENSIHARAQVLVEQLKNRRATSLVQARLKFLQNLSQPYGETDAMRRYEQLNKNRLS